MAGLFDRPLILPEEAPAAGEGGGLFGRPLVLPEEAAVPASTGGLFGRPLVLPGETPPGAPSTALSETPPAGIDWNAVEKEVATPPPGGPMTAGAARDPMTGLPNFDFGMLNRDSFLGGLQRNAVTDIVESGKVIPPAAKAVGQLAEWGIDLAAAAKDPMTLRALTSERAGRIANQVVEDDARRAGEAAKIGAEMAPDVASAAAGGMWEAVKSTFKPSEYYERPITNILNAWMTLGLGKVAVKGGLAGLSAAGKALDMRRAAPIIEAASAKVAESTGLSLESAQAAVKQVVKSGGHPDDIMVPTVRAATKANLRQWDEAVRRLAIDEHREFRAGLDALPEGDTAAAGALRARRDAAMATYRDFREQLADGVESLDRMETILSEPHRAALMKALRPSPIVTRMADFAFAGWHYALDDLWMRYGGAPLSKAVKKAIEIPEIRFYGDEVLANRPMSAAQKALRSVTTAGKPDDLTAAQATYQTATAAKERAEAAIGYLVQDLSIEQRVATWNYVNQPGRLEEGLARVRSGKAAVDTDALLRSKIIRDFAVDIGDEAEALKVLYENVFRGHYIGHYRPEVLKRKFGGKEPEVLPSGEKAIGLATGKDRLKMRYEGPRLDEEERITKAYARLQTETLKDLKDPRKLDREIPIELPKLMSAPLQDFDMVEIRTKSGRFKMVGKQEAARLRAAGEAKPASLSNEEKRALEKLKILSIEDIATSEKQFLSEMANLPEGITERVGSLRRAISAAERAREEGAVGDLAAARRRYRTALYEILDEADSPVYTEEYIAARRYAEELVERENTLRRIEAARTTQIPSLSAEARAAAGRLAPVRGAITDLDDVAAAEVANLSGRQRAAAGVLEKYAQKQTGSRSRYHRYLNEFLDLAGEGRTTRGKKPRGSKSPKANLLPFDVKKKPLGGYVKPSVVKEIQQREIVLRQKRELQKWTAALKRAADAETPSGRLGRVVDAIGPEEYLRLPDAEIRSLANATDEELQLLKQAKIARELRNRPKYEAAINKILSDRPEFGPGVIDAIQERARFRLKQQHYVESLPERQARVLREIVYRAERTHGEGLYGLRKGRDLPIEKDVLYVGPATVGDVMEQINWRRMMNDLDASPEIASAEPRPNWIKPTEEYWGPIAEKGKYVEPQAYYDIQEMRNVHKVFADHSTARKMWETWKDALTLWKQGKIYYSPATMAVNVWTNVLFGELSGLSLGISSHRRMLAFAVEDMAKNGEMYRRFVKSGGSTGMAGNTELYRALKTSLSAGRVHPTGLVTEYLGAIADKARKGHRFMGKVYLSTDEPFRYWVWLDRTMNKGLDDVAAAAVARADMLDYSHLPGLARALRATTHPFISFAWTAIPRVVRGAYQHPFTVAKWVLAAQMFEKFVWHAEGISDEEGRARLLMTQSKTPTGALFEVPLPNWLAKPFKSDVFNVLDIRNIVFPFEMLSLSAGGEGSLPQILNPITSNPLASVLYAWATGREPYTNREIYNPRIENDLSDRVPYLFSYAWKTIMPNLTPGLSDIPGASLTSKIPFPEWAQWLQIDHRYTGGYQWERLKAAYEQRNEWRSERGYRMNLGLALMEFLGIKIRQYSRGDQVEKLGFEWKKATDDYRARFRQIEKKYEQGAPEYETELRRLEQRMQEVEADLFEKEHGYRRD